MKEIKLTNGYVALVDDEDYDNVAKFSWWGLVCPSGNIYAIRNPSKNTGTRYSLERGKPQSPFRFLHHMILNSTQGVDHKNGNGLDNRRENLRFATPIQNSGNRPGRRGRKYKGVSWHTPRKKWRAYITKNRKQYHLGLFDSEEAAAEAYNVAAIDYWGEFAKLNVIERSH